MSSGILFFIDEVFVWKEIRFAWIRKVVGIFIFASDSISLLSMGKRARVISLSLSRSFIKGWFIYLDQMFTIEGLFDGLNRKGLCPTPLPPFSYYKGLRGV